MGWDVRQRRLVMLYLGLHHGTETVPRPLAFAGAAILLPNVADE